MRVGIVLRAAPIEHRRQIGAAAEPGLGRHHEAGVHVHRRHVRIVQMGDQRDARRPEPRVVGGAGNLLAEFGRELAEHGRDSGRRPSRTRGPCIIDITPPPPGRAAVVGAAPRRAHESAGARCRRAARRPAARPPAPRTPRRCRRAVARTRRARAALRVSRWLASIRISGLPFKPRPCGRHYGVECASAVEKNEPALFRHCYGKPCD